MTDSISSVLSQIRAYQGQLGQTAARAGDVARSDAIQALGGMPQAGVVGGVAATPSFTQTLARALEVVNAAHAKAGQLQGAFERGAPCAALARAVSAWQEAQVAVDAPVAFRNRL